MPNISIIIPTFNCAKYITEAIESVLRQTYKDIEVVVADDGSTDNTREVLRPYIENNKIIYIYQENQGPGAARNTGIKLAKGDYIAFLDADDTLTEDSIEKRLNLIECNSDIGLVFSDYFYQQEEFKTIEIKFMNDFKNHSYYRIRRTSCGILFYGLFKDIFPILFSIHTGTVLVRKEVFDKSGLFRTDIFIGEDRDMWLRIANNFKIGYINKPLGYYKRYRSSLTVDNPFKYGMNRLHFHYNLLNIYQKNKKIRIFLEKRLAIIYYDLACHFKQEKIIFQSLKYILKCIYYNPCSFLYYKFILSLFLPQRVRNLLKKMKV